MKYALLQIGMRIISRLRFQLLKKIVGHIVNPFSRKRDGLAIVQKQTETDWQCNPSTGDCGLPHCGP